MENLIKYKKYYLLEDYLFKEISKNFSDRKYLTAEEFFAIIIWKSNRAKTKVLNGIIKSNKTVEEITKELGQNIDNKEKLEILINIDGIGIPIASAILSVCYPNDFTIADYRVAETLTSLTKNNLKNPSSSIANYIDYINLCKQFMNQNKLTSLREADQILWGFDFYEGRNGLKSLIENL